SLSSNPEVVLMKALNGEIDMQFRHLGSSDFTLLLSNRDKGNYRVLKAVFPGIAAATYFNMNCKDQVLRKIFEDRRFRIALSLAIDRNTINQLFYNGLLKPLQATSVSYDPMWTKEIGESYIEYNPGQANKMLDSMGLTKRDKDGYRLRPDGKPLELTIEVYGNTDVYDLVASFWSKVGIKTVVKSEERSLWTVRVTGGEHQVAGYAVEGLLWQIDPGRYVPLSEFTYWAPLYGLWYATQGKSGEKPPQEILRLIELYEKFVSTPSEKARTLIGRDILRVHSRNLWMIGILGELPRPLVVNNNFRNVPTDVFDDYRMQCEGKLNPEQFFIKSSK
ncbi:MAG TPA: ABC transporter substrate-binding protein, partial [bacterium]|nr:ABC transporter substrate-binding protein [bacterium]